MALYMLHHTEILFLFVGLFVTIVAAVTAVPMIFAWVMYLFYKKIEEGEIS
ncbi:hypothetical protein [Bacillus phage PM1]|uniref:Uncharacterized protein n=1 Tax=Bacillus phage PM1 TaxID=547228 RepID=M4ZQZ6_9CAUD|nr:hypothetical protein K203_gp32 [Bacillus phage PM1]BAM99112.1 hypothetical protein [Bacillus phage PM1]